MESRIMRGTATEYTMQAVVVRTHVPANTLRSWERRYGIPKPKRGATGNRTYTETDVQVITRIRDLRATGLQFPEIILGLEGHQRQSAPSIEISPKMTPLQAARPQAELHLPGSLEQAGRALLALDPFPMETIANDMLVTAGSLAVTFDLILPVSRIVQGWYGNDAETNAGCDYAMSWLRRRLITLLSMSAQARERGKGMIVATPVRATRHDLPLLAHSIDLARSGYAVAGFEEALGVSTIANLAVSQTPDAILLGADSGNPAWEAIQIARRLRQAAPDVAIGLCGAGFTDHHLPAVDRLAEILPDQMGAAERFVLALRADRITSTGQGGASH